MDFSLKKHSTVFLLCICLLLSCNEGHQSSKDIQIVWATDYSEDGLDFLLKKDTTYIYPNKSFVLKKNMKYIVLSDQEFSLAKDILKDYFDNYFYDKGEYVNEQPFRLRKYFRQYIGYKKKDSLYVHVNLFTHFPTISNPECMCTIGPSQSILIYEGNGGRNYGTITINLSKRSVVYFKMSNADSNYVIGRYSDEELKVLFPSE